MEETDKYEEQMVNGEWIPVLEGARRNNRKQYGNNNSQGDKDNKHRNIRILPIFDLTLL